MKAEVIHEEFDCGTPCTPNGCVGHEGRIVGLEVEGWGFYEEDYVNGDTPQHPDEVAATAKEAVRLIKGSDANCKRCERLLRLAKRLDNWRENNPPGREGGASVWGDLKEELKRGDGNE